MNSTFLCYFILDYRVNYSRFYITWKCYSGNHVLTWKVNDLQMHLVNIMSLCSRSHRLGVGGALIFSDMACR